MALSIEVLTAVLIAASRVTNHYGIFGLNSKGLENGTYSSYDEYIPKALLPSNLRDSMG